MKWREDAPEHADARSIDIKGHPACGGCGKRLAHGGQWRCPWVGCRKWLRGLADAPIELDTEQRNDPQLRGEAA